MNLISLLIHTECRGEQISPGCAELKLKGGAVELLGGILLWCRSPRVMGREVLAALSILEFLAQV